LAQNAACGHILLLLQFTQVYGRIENENIGQFSEDFQEKCRIRNGQFLLGGVENVELTLK
jgi:hypothetical protein